ncbi:MAG: arabinan endo-1,5-alpha-L-arabinosidase [Thermogutta sp.]
MRSFFRVLRFFLLFFLVGSELKSDAAGGIPVSGPDPTVIAVPRAGDSQTGCDYYAFVTGRGIPILHSHDLKSWRPIGRVFDQAVPDWARREVPGSTGIWAPDVSYHQGRYYLYYAVSTFGSQRSVIGLAVNETLDLESPKYRWVDRGEVIDSSPDKCDYNAIDPALFVDDDGKWYLFFGSFWSGIKAVELTPGEGKPKPGAEIVPIAGRPNHPTHAIEAPFVVCRGGYYYLFASWDRCCDGAESDYKVVVGRSKHVLGPYLDFVGRPMREGGGTVILSGNERWRGPGHNCVLITKTGDWIIHHTYDMRNLDKHRILQVRPLTWTEDGWPRVGQPLSE